MFRMLKTLVAVPIIMACALGETVVLIKTIEMFTSSGDALRSSAAGSKE